MCSAGGAGEVQVVAGTGCSKSGSTEVGGMRFKMGTLAALRNRKWTRGKKRSVIVQDKRERGLITWVGGKLRREGVSSAGRGPSASYNRLSS